jgi:hypothetical protein
MARFIQHGGKPCFVLTRRSGEEIIIDEEIHITIVAIEGGRARLCITAPRETPMPQAAREGSRQLALPSTARFVQVFERLRVPIPPVLSSTRATPDVLAHFCPPC